MPRVPVLFQSCTQEHSRNRIQSLPGHQILHQHLENKQMTNPREYNGFHPEEDIRNEPLPIRLGLDALINRTIFSSPHLRKLALLGLFPPPDRPPPCTRRLIKGGNAKEEEMGTHTACPPLQHLLAALPWSARRRRGRIFCAESGQETFCAESEKASPHSIAGRTPP
uniref:Uncharacterized protein n=1 Tax=Arundo donax TaxID=35708 RepID=A0A0A9F1H8_ARUDO